MKKVRQLPSTVVSFLQRAASSAGRRRGEIHWSQTKKKFVKGNNRTLADEAQVLQYLRDHPDETTRQRAIIHLGPGVVPPAIPDVTGTAGAEIAQLVASIEEWKSGSQRNAQTLLEQGQETIRQLGSISQLLGGVQQRLDSHDAESQKLSGQIDGIQSNIRDVASQLKDQEARFGQSDQKLAESIAFNQRLEELLKEIRQQLEDLQVQIERVGAEGAMNRTSVSVANSYGVGWGFILAPAIVALLFGILITAWAVWDTGEWLDIPDIIWGVIAAAIVFVGLYVAFWSQAETNRQTTTGRS